MLGEKARIVGDESEATLGAKLPLVSVVIVTWNRSSDILETIQAVYGQAYQNIEIIVVDNGSTDGTVSAIRNHFPSVRLVALEQNVGAAKGRNAGIEAAHGDVVMFLDSDASLACDSLMNVVLRLQEDPWIGVINSKIVNADTKELDRGPGWVYSERQRAKQDTEFLSWSFSEGGAAIRKDVLDRTGGFWELLFFGCEGQDLGLRVWDAGYKILYYPKAIVYHRASLEARVDPGERDCLYLKNSLRIYLARYPWRVLLWYAPARAVAGIVRGARRGYLRRTLQVLVDVLAELPVVLQERRPVSGDTARSYLDLQRQHGPLSWDLVSWIRYKA